MLNAALAGLKQFFLFPPAFAFAESSKGKCSTYIAFWSHLSLASLRVPDHMEYKISDLANFKGAAPGDQWPGKA